MLNTSVGTLRIENCVQKRNKIVYCIKHKCQGKFSRPFSISNDQDRDRYSRVFSYFFCCKLANPPYRVISVQDIANIEVVSRNGSSDFLFDDQYLEMNDYPNVSPLSEDSEQTNCNTSTNKDIRNKNIGKRNGAENSPKKMCNPLQRKNKGNYIRLDETEDAHKTDISYVVSEMSNGYWNPTYFSLTDETDV